MIEESVTGEKIGKTKPFVIFQSIDTSMQDYTE